ncbi:MAG: amino acid ABC transporter substrate-binding protein [Rhodocyclaceae bacterium]|jgi:glutamate/aspartate transport system substrate-binding protein|nr:amino acid ABC transporter substrate-binding protein [Rhodocyclaceae bacterium]
MMTLKGRKLCVATGVVAMSTLPLCAQAASDAATREDAVSSPPASIVTEPKAGAKANTPPAAKQKATLDKIREYGAIYVGYNEASSPFSFMVGNDIQGYSWDLCQRVVDSVKVALNLPNLKVVPVPGTASSQLLMLMTGTIDLECGATTNTRIRQQSVAFGLTTFVSAMKVVVRRDSGITGLADLSGKVIAVSSGAATERTVNTLLATRGLSARIMTGRDNDDSFGAFESAKADAFVLNDTLLAAFVAGSSNRDKYRILDEEFGLEPYGIALRRDDSEFKTLVDGALLGAIRSGELEKLYGKWFMSPIPPKNINLQMPMTDVFKALLKNPNDKGV